MAESKDKYLGFPRSTFYRKRKLQLLNRIENTPRSFEPDETHSTNGFKKNNTTQPVSSTTPTRYSSNYLEDAENQPCHREYPEENFEQQACLLLNKSLTTVSVFPNLKEKPGVLKLCQLFQKHNLTDECCTDILKIIQDPEVITSRNVIPRSTEGFETATGVSTGVLRIGWRCRVCNCYTLKTITQSKRHCMETLHCCSQKMSYNDDHFILLSPEQILQALMPVLENEFLHHVNLDQVDLILNTDGAPLFKGSKSSFWPILAAVDDTLYHARKSNLILLGIWVGFNTSKPVFANLLNPIIQDLNQLHCKGFVWERNDGNRQKTIVKVTKMMCDSIARPLVQNIMQFNAEFGCGYCYHQQKGPYYTHVSLKDIKWRTTEDLIVDCNIDGSEASSHTRGVKGPSPLQNLIGFDMIYGFPPDVLHTVYLGVTKHLTEAWINSNNHEKSFYIKPNLQRIINSRLLNIKPPSRVSRAPRPIDVIKFYKGHEFMMWLLYYSPVVLKGILRVEYYDHWLLLVKGIAILTSSRVDNYIITQAEQCLEQFSSQIIDLYGKNNSRFNIHLLLHLGNFVRKFGPLQNYSMTIFENFNMQLQKYVTSSYGVGRQVCKRYMRDLIVKRSLTQTCVPITILECTDKVFYVPNIEEESLLRANDHGFSGFKYYSRVKFGSSSIHSKYYFKSYRHHNSYFMIDDNFVFCPLLFAQRVNDNKIYGIGTCYRTRQSTLFNLPHYLDVISTDENRFVELPDKLEILVHLDMENETVFVKFLNEFEANCE